MERKDAKDNLGCSSIKLGPLYLDTEPGSGIFFLCLDLADLGGVKLRFGPKGWKAEMADGRVVRGDWK